MGLREKFISKILVYLSNMNLKQSIIKVLHITKTTVIFPTYRVTLCINIFIMQIYTWRSRGNIVGTTIGYGLGDRRVGVRVSFSITSGPALGPIQVPSQWVPGNLTPKLKRQVSEAYHWSPNNSCLSYENTDLYIYSAKRLHSAILSKLSRGTTLVLHMMHISGFIISTHTFCHIVTKVLTWHTEISQKPINVGSRM